MENLRSWADRKEQRTVFWRQSQAPGARQTDSASLGGDAGRSAPGGARAEGGRHRGPRWGYLLPPKVLTRPVAGSRVVGGRGEGLRVPD